MKFAMMAIFAALVCLFFAPATYSQNGIQVETGTAAMVAHQSGQTAAADLSWVLVPVFNSSSDTTGNVNTFAVRSDAFIPTSQFGWTYYGVGVDLTLTKWLAAIGGKFLVPSDSVHLKLNGTVGAYDPTIGNPHVAGLVGGTVAWALNQSGTVTWNVAGCDYMVGVSPTAWGCTYGLTFGPFGGNNAQSALSAKTRRAVKRALKQ
jgi:hypothetical protein